MGRIPGTISVLAFSSRPRPPRSLAQGTLLPSPKSSCVPALCHLSLQFPLNVPNNHIDERFLRSGLQLRTGGTWMPFGAIILPSPRGQEVNPNSG